MEQTFLKADVCVYTWFPFIRFKRNFEIELYLLILPINLTTFLAFKGKVIYNYLDIVRSVAIRSNSSCMPFSNFKCEYLIIAKLLGITEFVRM